MNFFGFLTLRTLPRYKPGTDLTIMHSMTFPATTQRCFVSISYMTVAEIIVDNCQAVYQNTLDWGPFTNGKVTYYF